MFYKLIISFMHFSLSGAQLVTSSGDATVKIWDFSKAECVHTFTEHQHAGKCICMEKKSL